MERTREVVDSEDDHKVERMNVSSFLDTEWGNGAEIIRFLPYRNSFLKTGKVSHFPWTQIQQACTVYECFTSQEGTSSLCSELQGHHW